MLDDFKLYQFTFVLEALEYATLPPYKGGTFRGSFGQAFKNAVCFQEYVYCKECMVRTVCAYAAVFEPQISNGDQCFAKIQDIPRPFVFLCLSKKTEFRPGEFLTVELTLLGDTLKYLPYFICGFEQMGRIGFGKGHAKFRLHKIFSYSPGYQDQVIYANGEAKFEKCLPPFQGADMGSEHNDGYDRYRIYLNFITPTKLKFSGNFTDKLEFHILIRNLLRRISFIYYFYHGKTLDIDYHYLIKAAQEVKVSSNLNWISQERYSNRQQAKINMGGLTGIVCFEGDLGQFRPFINVGSYIHVGKGTVFGLGKYEILTRTKAEGQK